MGRHQFPRETVWEGVIFRGRTGGKESGHQREGVGRGQVGRRQFPIKKVREGVIFTGSGMGRRQFPRKKVWEGISSPGRKCGKASVPQEEVVARRNISREVCLPVMLSHVGHL